MSLIPIHPRVPASRASRRVADGQAGGRTRRRPQDDPRLREPVPRAHQPRPPHHARACGSARSSSGVGRLAAARSASRAPPRSSSRASSSSRSSSTACTASFSTASSTAADSDARVALHGPSWRTATTTSSRTTASRLVMPPMISWPLAVIFARALLAAARPARHLPMLAGTMAGYIAYDWVHYYTHHSRPTTAARQVAARVPPAAPLPGPQRLLRHQLAAVGRGVRDVPQPVAAQARAHRER